MATREYTITKTADRLTWIVEWQGLAGATADVGTPFDVTLVPGAGGADRSVQFDATFGTTTFALQGSNDGTNYVSLTDPQGNAIEMSATGLEQIQEFTRMIRPIAPSGSGTGGVCTVIIRGSR